jgi:putative flippase GtrA
MIEKIKALCIKHREIIVYLIVGVMTTVVAWAAKFLWNIVFYAGTAHPLPVQTTILTIVEFVAGVAFAYPTNRKWVFQSTNPNILKEAAGFVASRLATLGIQMLLNLVLINVLNMNFYLATVLISVVVVVSNYVFSKLLVFRKKKAD